MLMAVDFSRRRKSYSVHVFNLYYIVIDLELGQYFVGRILTICIINLYILQGMLFVLILL